MSGRNDISQAIDFISQHLVVGEIKQYAGSTAPNSMWLMCDGSEKLKADYPKLAAVLGNTYGTASDADHFKLPDGRGRVLIGASSGHALGSAGGSENIQAHTHSFTNPKIANHVHRISGFNVSSFVNGAVAGGARMWGPDNYGAGQLSVPAHNTTSSGGGGYTTNGAVGAVSGASTGTSGNMQPFLTVNHIIYAGGPNDQ